MGKMVKERRGNMRARLIICAAAMGLVLGFGTNGEGASYTYTKIADTSGPFLRFGFASINDGGTVAFSAALDAGGSGIFTGDGTTTPPPTIADTSGPFNSFSGFPSINNNGLVAFKAFLDTGGSVIFVSDGTATASIADATPGSRFRFVGNPSINDGGVVAFMATDSAGSGIFTGVVGATPSTIADTSGPFSSFSDNPSINNGNTAAFMATDSAGSGIFTGIVGTTPTTIVHNSGNPFSGFSFASINGGGKVAFAANLDAGGSGIFSGDGTTPVPIADTGGPFKAFNSPSINDNGMVAFYASLDAGGSGIYTGQDPVMDKVIALGDSLSGSTVNELTFIQVGLNNAGQVAFIAILADGTQGVYRADPEVVEDPVPPSDPTPEPDPVPAPSTVSVGIDIRPRHNPNTINLRSWGVVPVVIWSTATFDATDVDPKTITLANAPVKLWRNSTPMAFFRDVNRDGRLDLVVLVNVRGMDLDKSDTEAVLEGQMFDGTDIRGSDSVRIVPRHRRHGWDDRDHHRDARRDDD